MSRDSLRTGIRIDTRSVYCLFTRRNLGSDKKLNSVTVKRNIINNKVAAIMYITVGFVIGLPGADCLPRSVPQI